MLLTQPRTAFHLRITPSTVVRVILQIDQTKIQWYNENAFHPEVLKALQPVLMEHLVSDTHRKGIARRKKELEKTRVVKQTQFRLAYRFNWHDHTNESMMLRESSSNYRALHIYPYHLTVFIDEPHKDLSAWFATQEQ